MSPSVEPQTRSGQAPPGGAFERGLLTEIAESRSREAFVAFFKTYAPRLLAHFARRGADPATREELTQEVMLLVWRKAHLFDRSRGDEAAWLFALARNCFLDRVRRQRWAAADPAEMAAPGGGDPEPASALDVRRAVSALPDEQRAVMADAFGRGLSLSEIACERQLPLGTVKTRARLALERLRTLLGRTR